MCVSGFCRGRDARARRVLEQNSNTTKRQGEPKTNKRKVLIDRSNQKESNANTVVPRIRPWLPLRSCFGLSCFCSYAAKNVATYASLGPSRRSRHVVSPSAIEGVVILFRLGARFGPRVPMDWLPQAPFEGCMAVGIGCRALFVRAGGAGANDLLCVEALGQLTTSASI